MSYAAIPTRYAGVNFRSRLEARWACMFDALKWNWRYEPIDLSGYIPDFLVETDMGEMLVEVKPAANFDEMIKATEKIKTSGWSDFALVVGGWLRIENIPSNKYRLSHPDYMAVGLHRIQSTWGDWWYPARWAACDECSSMGIINDRTLTCLRCGEVIVGDSPIWNCPGLEALWHEAGNATQWRRP